MKFTALNLIAAVGVTLISLNANAGDYRELKWGDLKPVDWQAPPVRDQRFYEQNPDMQAQPELDAPVVEELDGQRVKLPGYVVQLEGDDRRVTEFLLVPYFGACIHVPPPPPNQIIHVTFPEGVPYATTYDAVWVSGTMKVEHKDADLALVGYQLEAAEVVSYF